MLKMTEYSRKDFIKHIVQMESMEVLEPEDDREHMLKTMKAIKNYYNKMSDNEILIVADRNGIILTDVKQSA